jgi:hypothetical protein
MNIKSQPSPGVKKRGLPSSLAQLRIPLFKKTCALLAHFMADIERSQKGNFVPFRIGKRVVASSQESNQSFLLGLPLLSGHPLFLHG